MEAIRDNSVPRVNLDELRARMTRLKGIADGNISESQPRLVSRVLHNSILESAVEESSNSPGESVVEPIMNLITTANSPATVRYAIVRDDGEGWAKNSVSNDSGSAANVVVASVATHVAHIEHVGVEFDVVLADVTSNDVGHEFDVLSDSVKHLKKAMHRNNGMNLIRTTTFNDSIDEVRVLKPLFQWP
jgi:anti-sigma factor ChrR (cupin superfamily)